MNDTPRDLNKVSRKYVTAAWSGGRGADDPSNAFNRSLRDHTATSAAARVSVHFERIEELFVDLSHAYEVVVGAVAWLTNTAILKALAKPRSVGIVVQKEDFLRRDAGFGNERYQRKTTRRLYHQISPFNLGDFTDSYPGQQDFNPDFNGTAQNWLFDRKGTYFGGEEAIRCMGFVGKQKERLVPRMHHKFLVFGFRHPGLIMMPHLVVTGSFNLTHNAVRSRENVVVVEDRSICQAYLGEWAQLWGMSEPLDWSSPVPAPDVMYVGT